MRPLLNTNTRENKASRVSLACSLFSKSSMYNSITQTTSEWVETTRFFKFAKTVLVEFLLIIANDQRVYGASASDFVISDGQEGELMQWLDKLERPSRDHFTCDWEDMCQIQFHSILQVIEWKQCSNPCLMPVLWIFLDHRRQRKEATLGQSHDSQAQAIFQSWPRMSICWSR